ncbi:MAG: hypothetical protein ACFFCV_13670 [Promethearchaeota archaeon]
MEKVKLSNNPKVESIRNKEKVGHKIESLWGENSHYDKNSSYESKKLMIKLETNGKEKRKITLKMESGSPNAHSNNYSLIFDLLKEFFNGTNNSG